jgi:hypothetical protein
MEGMVNVKEKRRKNDVVAEEEESGEKKEERDVILMVDKEKKNGDLFIGFLFALVETFSCQVKEFPYCYTWALWNGIPLKELYRAFVNYLENADESFLSCSENRWGVEYFEEEIMKFWSKHESVSVDKWNLVEQGMQNVCLLQYGKFKVRGYTYYSMDIEAVEKILGKYYYSHGPAAVVDAAVEDGSTMMMVRKKPRIVDFSVHVCYQNPSYLDS